jgi:hypothetical protein
MNGGLGEGLGESISGVEWRRCGHKVAPATPARLADWAHRSLMSRNLRLEPRYFNGFETITSPGFNPVTLTVRPVFEQPTTCTSTLRAMLFTTLMT